MLGQSDLLQQLSKALIERVLDWEMMNHLGYTIRVFHSSILLRTNGIS